MPHLDAKALETDPEGMALLREAIAPSRPVIPVAAPFAVLPAPVRKPVRLGSRIGQADPMILRRATAAL